MLLAVMASSFYWFQWRPTHIRKQCTNLNYILNSLDISAKKDISGWESLTVGQSSLNKLYRFCLANHGLKPESLFEPASLLDE